MKKRKKFSKTKRIGPVHILFSVLLVFSLLPVNISLMAGPGKADDTIPPISNAEPDIQILYLGDEAFFNASLSYDEDGFIVDYWWNFGDGGTGSGMTASHVYTAVGNYTVTLTITDDNNLISIDSCTVRVLELTPPLPSSDDDWPMFNHDPQHTGSSSSDAPDTAELLWTFTGLWPMTSPSIADGMVFVVHGEPFLTALNESTGETIWEHEISGMPSQPVIANDKVFVSTTEWGNMSDDVHIYCFDEFTGELLWEWNTTTYNWTFILFPWFEAPPLTVTNNRIYFGLSSFPPFVDREGSMIICLDDNTGDLIWNVSVTDYGLDYMNAPLTVTNDMIYVSYWGGLYALDENNGDLIWTFEDVNSTGFESAPAVTNGKVFIGSDWTNLFFCLDENTGSIIWQTSLCDNYTYTTPAVAYEKVFVGANGFAIDPIFALDENTGEVLWRYETSALVTSSPAVADNKVFNSYDDGTICALNEDAGISIWTYVTQAPSWFWYQSLAIAYGKLFASMGDTLFVFGSGGQGIQTPVAIAEPDFQTIFVGETAWFSGNGSYDPDGYIVSYDWDFGDGTYGSGVATIHVYAIPGSYTVTLTVTDDDGLSDSDWVYVIVEDNATNPFIFFTVPMDGELGVKLHEDIVISFSEPMNTSSVDWIIVPDPGGWNETWLLGDTELIISHWNPFEEDTLYTVHVVYGESKSGYPLIPGLVPNPWSFLTEGGGMPPVANAEPDFQIVSLGEGAWFDGILSYDFDGYIVSYDWDFGDGTYGSGVATTHVYIAPGNYTVTLTVTDDDGFSDSDWVYVIVEDNATNPFIFFTVPMDGELGVKLDENIVISFSEPMNTSSVDWIIVPDPGGWNETWLLGDTELILSHWDPFEEDTLYTVHVVSGESKSGYPLIPGLVPNPWSFLTEGGDLPPVANAEPDFQMVSLGEDAWFDGSLSYDPDGFIVNYTWHFGDGSIGWGINVIHSYFVPGHYEVTLWVLDNEGLMDFDIVIVFVDINHSNPTILLTDPADGDIGIPLDYSITIVFSDRMDPTTLNWTINPDPDGWTEAWSIDTTNLMLIHSSPFEESTLYEVEIVKIMDINGNPLIPGPVPNPWSFLTEGGGMPPVANAEPDFQMVSLGEGAWFDGSLSYDPDGYIVSYDWDFGDGTNGSGIMTMHVYSEPGNYTVTLTVTDDDNATGTDTVVVMVQELQPQNKPPVADAGKDRFASPFEELIFNGNGSFDLDGIIVKYEWDFGDGGTAVGMIVTHVFTDYNTYIVTLMVTDDDGATDTETCIVFADNEMPIAKIEPSTQTISVGEGAWFFGNCSYDPDGYITSYTWDFGDGTFGNGATVSNIYNKSGKYIITLTVTDNDGAVGRHSIALEILETESQPQPAYLEISKTKISGPDEVQTHTYAEWTLEIVVTNSGDSNAVMVVFSDVIPAEFVLISYTSSQGIVTIQNNPGNMSPTFITWSLTTVSPKSQAVLTLTMGTKENPAGKQEFTSPGTYVINQGCGVEGVDESTGKNISAATVSSIIVIAWENAQNISDEKIEPKLPPPPQIKPETPILILTAGLINIATFEDDIERIVPVEVTAYLNDVHNVHIELIDDGGLDIEIIPIVQDVPDGEIVRFYIKMKKPGLSNERSSEGVTIKLKAVGDEAESNVEYLDVMINGEVEKKPSTSDVNVVSTVGTVTLIAVLAAVIGRRFL